MKKRKFTNAGGLLISLIAIFTVTTSCSFAFTGIKGDGNVVKQERNVGPFSGIDVGGAFKVYLTQGDQEKVVVEADENLMDVIETEVHGGTLKISTKEDIRDSKALNIYITFKTLHELEVSGACHLTGENKFSLGDLELDCSGASDVVLKFSAESVEMDCSGASKVELYGSAEKVELDLSGASSLDAFEFEANKLEADVSGASHGRMTVKETLSADVSGAAGFKYKGEPTINDIDVSGAGSLKKE